MLGLLMSTTLSCERTSGGGTGSGVAALRATFDEPVPKTDVKTEWFERMGRLAKRLVARESERDAAIEYLATHERNTSFADTLGCAVLTALLAVGDLPRLKALLSKVPFTTDAPDGYYVEFAVVNPHQNRPIEWFTVLFDSYDASRESDVRESLAASVRRAFHNDIKREWTDADVMRNCRREFQTQIKDLKANQAWSDAYSPGVFDVSNIKAPPLFIPKDGPDRVEERRIDR